MAKTAGAGRRHAESLIDFFGELGSSAKEEVDALIKKYKKSKYLKQALRRFEEQGLVQQTKSSWLVTAKGKFYFQEKKLVSRLRNHDLKKWDGKWRLITYDVPANERKKRDRLRELLQHCGFYQLQKSVWIYPSYIAKDLWRILVEEELDKFCRVMTVKFLEDDKDVRSFFNITTRG